jgi:hypothetical protein
MRRSNLSDGSAPPDPSAVSPHQLAAQALLGRMGELTVYVESAREDVAGNQYLVNRLGAQLEEIAAMLTGVQAALDAPLPAGDQAAFMAELVSRVDRAEVLLNRVLSMLDFYDANSFIPGGGNNAVLVGAAVALGALLWLTRSRTYVVDDGPRRQRVSAEVIRQRGMLPADALTESEIEGLLATGLYELNDPEDCGCTG